ncbi:MAG TPA: response regulator [Caulobacteraceae bacterium]|jgi:signal transduction histidine kinase|nr:response regulator [Caulobacteraceae bacterium]
MRFRLFTLIAAVVLPSAVLFSLLIVSLYLHERAARERQLFSTARATAAAVDADLGRGWALLEALSNSEELAAGDWRALDREARSIAPADMAFVLVDPARGQLINTRLPLNAALPHDVPGDTRDRWRLLQGQERIFSDVFVDRTVARPTVAIDLLVRRRGQPAHMLSLLMDPAIQARLLADQKLPPGWIGGLLDHRGVSIARSPTILRYVGQPGAPDLVARVLRGDEGVMQSTTRDGQRMVAAYARTPSSGWTAVVAAPRAEFEEGVVRSLGAAFVLSLVILVCSALLALSLSRRLLTAMVALEAQAEAVGQGQAAGEVSTGLIEADRVSQALAHAADERLAHETELAALNAGLEARVMEATDRLVQAQKMEALGQLTGGVAHDFNNLLTAVLGNLALIKRTNLNERQAHLADGALSAGERGARLTRQLLAFSRRQRLTPESVDITALVAETRELMATTLGGSVRLTVEQPAGPLFVLADRTQLELALLNLAINARDAMPGGGALAITVGEQEIGQLADQEGAPPPGRYGAIAIRDSGMGMTAKVRRRVFEPFFTTKGPGEGSGLGLPQALGMARQLGGGMTIESKQGEGATVTLLLPLAAPGETIDRAAVRRAAASPDLGGLKVLLVDDDAAARAATAEMLSVLGCQVSEADNGETALATLADDTDVVLADFAMPGMNGADLAMRLAAARPGLPVLLITGFADPYKMGEIWSGPLLSKPFDLEGLAAAVRSAADGAEALV